MSDTTGIADGLDAILAAHDGVEGALLPILHAVQATFGHIPDEALPRIARHQMISRAEVWGVLTFYHDFRTRPAGRHVLKLCRAESCQAMGAAALADHARARLGIDWHGTTPDGQVTLEPVFCLGLCACGPAAMLDGQVAGRVDPARLDRMIGELA
ncbi:formate dehydrogenase subunit gamma [Pseudogemmobacter sonorensis]|uniref:formate dehydrogenase subunit gamma n=1 Tax=Pseudogemmobacter sonorensis TaxID=2989681 RepID=UPI0036B06424